MVKLKRILVGLLVLACVLVAWQFLVANPNVVTLRTLVGDIAAVALGKALLASFLMGVCLGALVVGLFWQVKWLQNQYLKRRIKQLEQALAAVAQVESPVHHKLNVQSASAGETRVFETKTGETTASVTGMMARDL